MRYSFLLVPILAVPIVAASVAAPVATAQGSPVTYYMLRDSAETALATGEYGRAAELLRRLAQQTPEDSELWARLAESEFRLERYSSAVAALEHVQNLGHTFGASGSFTVGLVHARLGNDSVALAWIQRALAEGYGNRPRLRTDAAFNRLRADSVFRGLAGIPRAGLPRNEGWRFDLAYLKEEAQRMHADPGRPASGPVFTDAVARLVPTTNKCLQFITHTSKKLFLCYLSCGFICNHNSPRDTRIICCQAH